MFNSTVSLSHFHPTKSFFVSASCGLKAEKILENQIKKLALLGLGSQNSLAPTNFTNKLIPKLFGLPCPRFQLMLGHKGEVGQQWQLFLLQNEPPFVSHEVWGVEVLLFFSSSARLRAASWRHPAQCSQKSCATFPAPGQSPANSRSFTVQRNLWISSHQIIRLGRLVVSMSF